MQPELVARPAPQRQGQMGPVAEDAPSAAELGSAQLASGSVGHEHARSGPRRRRRRRPSRAGTLPCRRASCRATAAGRAGHRRAGRSDRRGATLPSFSSSRQPTISRTPVTFAASCARTMPARLLRSVSARASIPSRAAWANSSSHELAPRRNEKCDAHLRARRSSSEHAVQEPALRAGAGILAVTVAEQPEALAGLGLDLEIVAHGGKLGVAAATIRRRPAPAHRRASPGGGCRAR